MTQNLVSGKFTKGFKIKNLKLAGLGVFLFKYVLNIVKYRGYKGQNIIMHEYSGKEKYGIF